MRSGWISLAALATWLICGLPPLLEIAGGTFSGLRAAVWSGAYLLYGAALVVLLYRSHRFARLAGLPLFLLVVQSVTGLAMTVLSDNGTSAATLVIVAAALPYVVRPSIAWAWAGTQSVVLGLLYGGMTTWINALTAAVAIGGFQLFALASSFLARSESEAREELARTNAELLSARALLVETSRSAERLRISRDLHDTLGHHLTALSLQLDVTSRLAEGKAAEHALQAHAITRLLLSDVRDVVSELRGSRFDLGLAIRSFADAASALAVHLELPAVLEIEEGARADALLKCVQEVITNTTRHAAARNLWIAVTPGTDDIALHARDDGRGARAILPGNGLTGMRERFEALGGRVEFRSGEGHGFEVHGFLPKPRLAS